MEREKRGFIKLNLVSLAFTVAAILFVLVAIACIVALPAVFSSTDTFSVTALIAKIVRWPILLLVVGLVHWITWGSAFAAVGWIVVSIFFSWYTAHFGTYNKTYGSLGAVVGFMVWTWLSTAVILIGAELNAEMEHQTTTTGCPKPLGAGGAKMADTVGAAQG